ncbi:unnamed protein product [Caenorhabditis sp. 36 PRJEB53466]|nr:unnamed protein product [Caenorhabditis sp. 36 PRJEB53466]
MRFKPSFSLAISITLVLLACGLCEPSAEETENGEPVFYCFVDPPAKTRVSPDLLSNITACTHFVYGRIPIDKPSGHPEYSVTDVYSDYGIDNLRTFIRMKSRHPSAKFLLGVVRTKPFEDNLMAQKVADGVLKAVKSKQLDGVFIRFEGNHLEYRTSTAFIKSLASNEQLSVTFGVSGRRVFAFEAVRRLREINEHVEHIYLDMGELPSNEDPYQITQINPLFSNTSIPFEETIQGTVQQLTEEGLLPHRLVIGLTAGGWKFEIKDAQDPLTVIHGQFAKTPGRRVSYQDACRARGAVVYNWEVMNEVTVYRQTWISVNLPTKKALGEKIKWILSEHFAGLGISSALSDDPSGECGTDALPAHTLAMEMLRTSINSNVPKCTRLCYLDPSQVPSTFPIDNLKSEFCTHLVVHYFDLDLRETVLIAEGARELIEKIDEWRKRIIEVAPKLILSLGSKQTTGVWQFIVANDFRRKELAEQIIRSVNESTADGIEVSWTLEAMTSEFDKKNLKAFIDDVLTADTDKKTEILVATTADSAYSDFYDYEHLNKTASLIVLHSHRLHSESAPFTGHPSPISATSSMKVPKMTWESVYTHWTTARKVARSKIVLSLSASTISIQSLADERTQSMDPFGQAALISLLRSKKSDIHSLQEVCESVSSGTALNNWVPIANVPYLRRYDQMVAYESPKSAHIKAVWASMERAGGLALHNIQHDDPHAVCDNRTAFPLLSALSRAHVCSKCLTQHDFKKCHDHEFVVSCRYELKKSNPVFKTDIVPYERCTEVIVEQAKLVLGGNITFETAEEERALRNLTEMRPKMLKCGLVLALSCGDSERHLNSILGDNMTSAIDNVLAVMDKYKFSGVQLDCERPIRRGNHIYFNTFVRKLSKMFEKSKASNGCNRTISARFSHYTRNPSSYFSISLLNKLSHVSLRMSSQSSVDAPSFFANPSDPKAPSTEKFVKMWKEVGLRPDKLVLEISPFGFESNGTGGGVVRAMGQGEVCQTVGNRAVFRHDYEQLNGAVRLENGTMVHAMSADDLAYKIGYARRENLGGIALNSVNGDDYTGICGRGSFPLLKSIYTSVKCQ